MMATVSKSLICAGASLLLAAALGAPASAQLGGLISGATAGQAVVPDPVVEGPITGGIHGRPWQSYVPDYGPNSDIAAFGYVEEEFFVSGTSDQQTPFKTRIVVRRPGDPAEFSGTVFAEWVNVTGGSDLETLWPAGHPTIMREGHAYVVMSVQLVGVTELRAWDAVRYGSLDHPGADHDDRIMEQLLQAIKDPVGTDPMGGLTVDYLIVAGDSQSAGGITDYIANGYEIEGLVDGWIPGRGGTNAFTKQVMEELEMPMIVLLEENQAERPADSDYYRVFYGAGQSHAPWDWASYVHAARVRDVLQGVDPGSAEDAAGRAANGGTGGINRSYSRMMVRAGIHWINRMVRAAAAGGLDNPPIQPRLDRDTGGDLLRDADGHALGGIRYPDIHVPVGLNTSEGLALFGIFDPWTAEEIVARYPTRQLYLGLVEDAIDAITPSGMLLPEDADEIRADAAALPVWDGDQARACYNEGWGFPPDPLNPCLALP